MGREREKRLRNAKIKKETKRDRKRIKMKR